MCTAFLHVQIPTTVADTLSTDTVAEITIPYIE